MKHRKQPPGYCTQCKCEWPADEMSIYEKDTCWRHSTAPVKRIETKQEPRVPGSKL